VLEARGLTKCYATLPAVNDVSFSIRPGEILGYLGPNGSGKSTTVKMLRTEYTMVKILLYIVGLMIFSSLSARLSQWILGWTPGLLLLLPMVFVMRKVLARLREQNAYQSQLVFEDQPHPALELLNLSGN